MLALLLMACGEDATTGPSTATTDTTPQETVTTPYTWADDIQPLVYDACTSCHQPEGIGPRDFTTYEAVYEARDIIAAWVELELMPLPTADPTCRDYEGSERIHLSDDERAMFLDWLRGGAPEGDSVPGETPPLYDGHLDSWDYEFRMPNEHTVQPDADGNEYWCEVPDNPLPALTWIKAFDVDLGQLDAVHHVCIFADLNNDAGSGYGVDDPSGGFPCADPIVEADWLPLYCWAPGMDPVVFPEGMGMLASGSVQPVIQMHYYWDPDKPEVTDRSAVRVQVTDAVDTQVEMLIMGPTDFRIPAGEPAYTASQSVTNRWNDATILGAFPHMHLLGRSYEATVTHQDGTEECVLAGEYDFDHQLTYIFRDPVAWNTGDELTFSCTWDNSADNDDNPSDPPQDVTWGEGTTDEMCFLLFYAAGL